LFRRDQRPSVVARLQRVFFCFAQKLSCLGFAGTSSDADGEAEFLRSSNT
jgi:hypothetical protein